MQDWLGKMMPDPEKWAAQFAAHPVASRPVVMPTGEPLNVPDGEPTQIRKLGAVIEVPEELLMDYGVIPDTRPKPPPPSWRTRFRRKRRQWREQAARRAYKVIAGDWPDNGEDDW